MRLVKKILAHPERNSLLSNFGNYGIYSLSIYIVPLITIPYIIRVVGIEKFGILSLALAVSNYFRVAADYGWSTLGVQYIAKKQNSVKDHSEIISVILLIQLSLTVILFLILLIITVSVPSLNKEFTVYVTTFGLVPGNLLMTTWFYVGIEKVKFLNIVNFSSKILYVFLIFIFLTKQTQYYLVPIFNTISLFSGAVISIILLKFKFRIYFCFPRPRKIILFLKDGWPIFISSLAGSLYRNSNIIILAFFVSESAVGIYAAADKIIRVFQGAFAPITQTLYPYISRIKIESQKRAETAIKTLCYVMSSITGFIVIILFFSADWIMYLLINKYTATGISLLRIGLPTLLFGILNYIIGIIYMTNFGLKQYYSKAVLITGMVNLFLCTFLSFLMGSKRAMLSFTISEFFLLFVLLIKIQSHSTSKV